MKAAFQTVLKCRPTIYKVIPDEKYKFVYFMCMSTSRYRTNSHLYRFKVGAKEYGEPDPDNEFYKLDLINSKRVKLGQVITVKGSAFEYEYDFGDGWIHNLIVEDISEPVTGAMYPICLDGERACPPEDCGGPFGYSRLLGVMVNQNTKNITTSSGGSVVISNLPCSIQEANRELKLIWLP